MSPDCDTRREEARWWSAYPNVDQLLDELRRRRWLLYVFGPEVVAHVFRWPTCADVVLLRGEQDATAYRAPTFPDSDVFAPELVSWQYHAPAAWTLRAVLTIEPPDHPDAPRAVLTPEPGCFIPDEIRKRVTVRPLGFGEDEPGRSATVRTSRSRP